jgi:hypothetical protein
MRVCVCVCVCVRACVYIYHTVLLARANSGGLFALGSSGGHVADWLLINWLRRAASSFPSPLARSRAAQISESDWSSGVDAEIDTPERSRAFQRALSRLTRPLPLPAISRLDDHPAGPDGVRIAGN